MLVPDKLHKQNLQQLHQSMSTVRPSRQGTNELKGVRGDVVNQVHNGVVGAAACGHAQEEEEQEGVEEEEGLPAVEVEWPAGHIYEGVASAASMSSLLLLMRESSSCVPLAPVCLLAQDAVDY